MVYRAFYEDKAKLWINRYSPDATPVMDHTYAKVSRPANPPPTIPPAAAAQLRQIQYDGPPVQIPDPNQPIPNPNPPNLPPFPRPTGQQSQPTQPLSALSFLQGAVPIGSNPGAQGGPAPPPQSRFDFYLA